ncbi:TrbI/VirB10 family protein [Chlorogloeopsis sp. ULAP01]|uniref:TrbI/VirB10 family protein n=1 Tax=Chlorogloeopsis sp. ULAP01 TaxID=3056483 RepID=UPI0025AB288A|nr:TrbI/VirB10 family protein [Chlorogloeopsis sp. ULAP01]MDM9381755.1 TrbI/VirB10 family protein [Chlorogloeopsis sp. ULAP01]
MTRYSIPSDTHSENLVTSNTENYQSEIDFSDWELRMARLVGFEEELPARDREQLEDPVNLQPTPPAPVKPAQAAPTEQPLSSNPFAKLALVGTATFVLVLFAGIFLTQLMNGSTKKPIKNNIVAPQTRSLPTTESRLEQLEGEVETLKTKLALAEQAQAVKLAQQQLRNAKLASTTPVAAQPTPRARQSVALRTPTPERTVYVSRVVERPVPVPQTPQQPVIPQLPPSPPPVVNTQATPTPTPDPLQEWARLAKLGSYGQVVVAAKPNGVNTSTVQDDTPEPVVNTRRQQPRINPRTEPTEEPETPVVSQASSSSGSSKSIPVGTSAKAVLATGVFGETSRAGNNSRNESRKNVFVVRLKEPLKAADGSVILPAKTELLTEIRSLSDQGLLQLNVVKAIIQNNGNLTERSLPENAMLINGSQGKPLVANQFSKKGSLMGRDAGQFVLGGIGKAAELFNRTESEVITTPTGTVVSNRNPRRNLWAGVLEGGVRTVVPQITQRNQQAMSQMMQRTNVWFLPAGTEVEVYINQTMQL